MIEKSLKLLFLILKLNNEIAIVFIPDSTIEEIRMNLIQAYSPYKPRRGGELLNC